MKELSLFLFSVCISLFLFAQASQAKEIIENEIGLQPPSLFINSAVDRMHAGHEDFIKVLNLHKIYSEVITFETSPHSFPLFEPTVKCIDEFLKKIFIK